MPTDYLNELYQHFRASNGVFTDSRQPLQGGLFFALSGPNFNGNKFAEQAIGGGASAAVVDDADYQKDSRYLLVDNALEALQNLARHHREQFDIPVFGLTGSNGKTTTKELLAAVLGEKFRLTATRGNLNNHIGVPLTLLRIDAQTELALIEMGANHQGEIKVLSEIARPTHGLITNIGKAHIEGFGGVEGIKKGKKELYDFLAANNGKLFVNQSDEVLKSLVPPGAEVVGFGNEGDHSCQLVSAEPFVKVKFPSGNEVDTQLIGVYNYQNIRAAVSVGDFFEVPTASIEKAIAGYSPDMNRSEVIKRGTNTIVLDAYNANPDSMQAALESISKMNERPSLVILGDMLELGDESEEEHRLLGQRVAALRPDGALFCGPLVKESADQVPGALHFETKPELVAYLEANSVKDHTILIKASRGIGLETILDYLD